MHRLILQTVTVFGEATLLIPAAGVVAIYLWLRGMRQVALVWATTFAICVCATILLKIGFNACGDRLEGLGVHSPSGHVGLSLTFYGGLAVLVGRTLELRLKLAVYVLALIMVIAVAASRLLLHAHTQAEIAVGALVGLASLSYFGGRLTGRVPILSDWVAIGSAFAVVGIITHGHHAPTESVIVRLAQYLRSSTQICAAAGPGASGFSDLAVGLAIHHGYVGASTGPAGSATTIGMSIR